MGSSDYLEIESGNLTVKDKDGGIHPVPTPKGVSDLAFRNAVAVVVTFYLNNGTLPTVPQMHESWQKIPEATYAKIVVEPEFAEALSYRGIEWHGSSGLTLEQRNVLIALSDPTDRASLGTKLRRLKVPYSVYQAWMRQPHFAEARRQQAEHNMGDAVPMLLDGVVSKAETGDLNAIKLRLEISGRYNPQQQQVQDAKAIVQALAESVVRHVKDPEVRSAILSDMREQADMLMLQRTTQLEG